MSTMFKVDKCGVKTELTEKITDVRRIGSVCDDANTPFSEAAA
jgi:hypothetical protein